MTHRIPLGTRHEVTSFFETVLTQLYSNEPNMYAAILPAFSQRVRVREDRGAGTTAPPVAGVRGTMTHHYDSSTVRARASRVRGTIIINSLSELVAHHVPPHLC